MVVVASVAAAVVIVVLSATKKIKDFGRDQTITSC